MTALPRRGRAFGYLAGMVLAGVLVAPVAATGASRPSLERDVQPILTRYGCNAGACHGKARGQNGFQLSLFGFDPAFDLDELVHDARGRRVFPAAPEQS